MPAKIVRLKSTLGRGPRALFERRRGPSGLDPCAPSLVRRLFKNGASTALVNRIVDERQPIDQIIAAANWEPGSPVGGRSGASPTALRLFGLPAIEERK